MDILNLILATASAGVIPVLVALIAYHKWRRLHPRAVVLKVVGGTLVTKLRVGLIPARYIDAGNRLTFKASEAKQWANNEVGNAEESVLRVCQLRYCIPVRAKIRICRKDHDLHTEIIHFNC